VAPHRRLLASDEARWLTGVTLAATGGRITSGDQYYRPGLERESKVRRTCID